MLISIIVELHAPNYGGHRTIGGSQVIFRKTQVVELTPEILVRLLDREYIITENKDSENEIVFECSVVDSVIDAFPKNEADQLYLTAEADMHEATPEYVQRLIKLGWKFDEENAKAHDIPKPQGDEGFLITGRESQ
jgi:hypothetical protein